MTDDEYDRYEEQLEGARADGDKRLLRSQDAATGLPDDDREAEEQPGPPPANALFSARAIGWCTLFFSPLVGGLMAAANHRRLGEEAKARGTAALAIGAIVAFFLIGYFVDSTAVNGAVGGGTGTLAWAWYREQKPRVAAHLRSGGRLAKPWMPLLAGVLLIALGGLSIYLELNSTSNTAFRAGVVAAQAEDWPTAEARFRDVLVDDPSRDDARYNLGLSLMNQGKNRAARRELGRVHDDSEVAEDAHRLRRQLSP